MTINENLDTVLIQSSDIVETDQKVIRITKGYIYFLLQKANELGLQGKIIEALESAEDKTTGGRLFHFITHNAHE